LLGNPVTLITYEDKPKHKKSEILFEFNRRRISLATFCDFSWPPSFFKPPSNNALYRKQENKPHNNFVTTTTLLEPNNVIPSWEFGGEEKKEVSVTMRKLRQQFD